MKFNTLVRTLATMITLTTATYAENKFAPIVMGDGLMIFVPILTKNLYLPPELSEELVNTLSYMGNEERLAYDVYNRLYQEWGIKTFTNIANKSEIKHIQHCKNKSGTLYFSIFMINTDLFGIYEWTSFLC